MKKTEEEFENESESIINRKPKGVSEEDIKKGFELTLKRDFNLTDDSIKLIYEMAEDKQISISALQRKFKMGYSKAETMFRLIIYFYAPQLIKNIEKAIVDKIFNIKEVVFIDRGKFIQLQQIGNLFEICKNTENEYEFEIIDTEKFRELYKIILGIDFVFDFRKNFSRIDEKL